MFLGRHDHNVDTKGRLSIPAAMRMALQETEKTPVLSYTGRCLKLYPYEAWRAKFQRLESRPFLAPEVQAYQRLMFANSVECPIDSQGRILIPPFLRRKAKIEREVTIFGHGSHIEIWDRERFEEEEKRADERLEHLETEVSKSDL